MRFEKFSPFLFLFRLRCLALHKKKNSLEGLGPDLLGDLKGAVDVVLAVEEDLGLDDRAQAGGYVKNVEKYFGVGFRERKEKSDEHFFSRLRQSLGTREKKKNEERQLLKKQLTLRDRAVAGEAVGRVLDGDVGRTGADGDSRTPLAEAGALFYLKRVKVFRFSSR